MLLVRTGRKGALGTERSAIVLVELIDTAGLLFLQLHGAHPSNSLFPFDPLFLPSLQYLLVLDTEFAPLNIKTVQSDNNSVGISSLTEIGESQATEGALLIEMVVESVGCWNGQRCLWMERRVR